MKFKARYGHFDWIAPFYDRVFGAATHDALFAHLAIEPGQTVLDIGGGTGRVAQRLTDTDAQIIVVDPSPQMLAHAHAKQLPGVRGLAEGLPFATASIDRILVVEAFHHFADQPLAARELVRVLRLGGRLVIEEPDIRHLSVKGIALAEKLALMQSHFYSPPALAELFAAVGGTVLAVTPDRISAHVVVTIVQ
jgi:ubiquinone/menaquinone biosynthesis C-methylase UbiE